MPGILVVAEHAQGKLADISTEMIGAAMALKKGLGGPLVVTAIAQHPEQFRESLDRSSVDDIALVKCDSDAFDTNVYEEAVCRIAEIRRPKAILVGHGTDGMSFASAVAVRLGTGFAADVFAATATEDNLQVTRGGYGGKVSIDLAFPGKDLVVLMIRPSSFQPPTGAGSARISTLDLRNADLPNRSQHIGFHEPSSSEVDISKSEFILAIGRGINEERYVQRFASLAEKLDAVLGCSRPVADAGWVHKSRQVGLTGKVASSCKLYLALGISGAIQHLHGMKHVDTIIAVNTDPHAPIFNVADYGVCMDLFAFADALEARLS